VKFMLQRFDRVKVERGFYTGYAGCVISRRSLLWYSICIGGREVFIGRWNLRFIGHKNPKLHNKIRNRMIQNDRDRNKLQSL